MLGYLLARAGIDVVVLEKWPDFFRDFRGDTIHPSTMEVLDELGLLPAFLKLPHNNMELMTLHIGYSKVTVADLRHLKTKCPYIAFIPQWDFLNFLSDEAKKFPSFHLLMETEAEDLIEENGRVVGVRAASKEGEILIRAELVVGADGRHSTIREKGKFEVEELGVPIDVLWFRVPRKNSDDQQSLGYARSGGVLIMLDRREYWQCAYIIEKDGFERVKERGLDAFRTSIASIANLTPAVLSEIDSWEKVKLLSVSVDHVRSWAKEGVLLIGDAAHAMSPIGGVGINDAIQDAVASANALIPVLRNEGAPLSVLKAIQQRRERPARKMQRLQIFLHNHVLFPILQSKKSIDAPWYINLFAWFPVLRRIPAHVIGIGFLPEHMDTALFKK
jgi:2-polyprenyl-6-methoxyphenol hydroxylase-like FAD-dependent oxidoreductase